MGILKGIDKWLFGDLYGLQKYLEESVNPSTIIAGASKMSQEEREFHLKQMELNNEFNKIGATKKIMLAKEKTERKRLDKPEEKKGFFRKLLS